MKRAAIVITDSAFERIVYDDADMRGGIGVGPWEVETSEQLLADLRTITRFIIEEVFTDDEVEAAARVRAAIGEDNG